jgi:hypothetical protein
MLKQYLQRITKQLGARLSLELAFDTPLVCGNLWAHVYDANSLFKDSVQLSFLPIIYVMERTLTWKTIQNLHLLLRNPSVGNTRVALLVLFTEEDVAMESQELLNSTMRGAYAYDIVVLDRQRLVMIASARKPRNILRHLILSHISLTSVSPFITTGPASGRSFFGREQELRKITDLITKVSLGLIGGRRVGKTSILTRLHLNEMSTAGFYTLYHDCSTTPTYDTFFAAAIRDWQPEPPFVASATFNELLQSSPDDKSLVLLLDEADKLVPADRTNGWPLFNALRALANSGRAQVVLSGERTLRNALRDPKSPLFNFSNEILLGPLDYRAVEELVTRPMKQLEIELGNEKIIVNHIWNFTSGHPNVVQRLCRQLIERLNEQGTRRITLDDVDAVIEDPGFQRDDFLSTYWEAATPLEKIISLLMSDNRELRTLQSLRQALEDHCGLQPSAREIDNALQRLVDLRSILKRTPIGYEFAVKAFPRVVAGTMTLNDMLMILTEEYQEQDE